MQRSIYDFQIILSSSVLITALLHNCHYKVICDICHENQRIIGFEVDRMVIRNSVHIAYDLFCLPRNKLASKLVIPFVTVVFFGVVTGCHNNTCQCIPELHRKTQLRRRTCVGMKINTNSHSTQNICCRSGKELAVISSIITNYHTTILTRLNTVSI